MLQSHFRVIVLAMIHLGESPLSVGGSPSLVGFAGENVETPSSMTSNFGIRPSKPQQFLTIE